MEQNEQLYKEIKNNARFTVECLSLNHEGQGVCKITGIKDKSFEVTDRIVINLINEIII